MFLRVNNLSKKYGAKTVLENISFNQEKGEIISLIGTSGIGKSTLLKCIAGLSDINAGEINLNNNKIHNLEPNNRKISYVFQESPLFPHINVLDNILFNMSSYDEKKLDFLLDKTELKNLVKRFPFELSGGENQRAAVVRSLIRNPDLLLLDEPFSNLDTVNKKYVKEIVFEIIKESNLTTIIVNHDIEESLEISDKIMIIKNGKIEESKNRSFRISKFHLHHASPFKSQQMSKKGGNLIAVFSQNPELCAETIFQICSFDALDLSRSQF